MKTVIDTNPFAASTHYCFGVCPKFPKFPKFSNFSGNVSCRYCAQDRRVRGYK